jgi:hypothetical protein
VAVLEMKRRIQRILWTLVWIIMAFISISLNKFNPSNTSNDFIYFFLSYFIAFLCIILSITDHTLAFDLIKWIKELDVKKFILNFSNKWFEWLKWISIIAAISYVQAETSDHILLFIVLISYGALCSSIAIQLNAIFKNITKYNKRYLKNSFIEVPSERIYVLSLATSLLFVITTYKLIEYIVNKIQEVKLL